jgi:hypothetical protein
MRRRSRHRRRSDADHLAHRAWREERVLAALGPAPLTVEEIVPGVYDDTPPERHGLAARSALAHLIKLAGEGRARQDPGGAWLRADAAP